MPKSVLTFVAGATAASAAILIVIALGGSPDSSESPASAAVRASAPEQSTSTSPARDPSSAAAADSESPRPTIGTSEDRSIGIGEEPASTDGGVEPTATGPVDLTLPIPVSSPELASHLERQSVAAIHAEISGEAWDSGWARTTENEFARFYASQPELIVEYGNPVVHCRSTLCEIQVVAYGATPGNWLRLNGALFDQPWADQFGEGPIGHGYAVSVQGEALVITHWVRREESEIRSHQPTSAVI